MTGMTGIVVLIAFITFVTVSAQRNGDLRDGILSAQCKARCFEKYGTPAIQNKDDVYPMYRETDCKRHNCRQCMMACGTVVQKSEDCPEFCANKTACIDSCAFILRERKGTHTTEGLSQEVISKPEVLCKDIPYSRHGDNICQEKVASLSLKWQTTFEVAGNQVVYVISAREMDSTIDEPKEWQVLQTASSNFVRVKTLSCDTKYQFKITSVTRSGVIGQSRDSDWITTPTEPRSLTPPRNLRVIHQSLYRQRPSAVIAWDQLEDSGCFYRLYWMSRDRASQEEIEAPPEFKYRIEGLQFSSNYTVRLHSYDEELIKGSKQDATISFVTPGCLQATNYNYTVCPPEAPGNIKLTILTANPKEYDVDYVNTTISWDPPAHTNHGEEIIQYVVEWRKEPPIQAAHLIVDHHGKLQINATNHGPPDTSVVLYNLHNHNEYSIMLWAKTGGGLGKVAKRIIPLGLPVANQTPKVPQEKAEPIDHEGLTTVELLIVILVLSVMTLTFAITIWYFAWKRRSKSKQYTPTRRCRAMEELNPIYDGVSPCSVSYDRQSSTETDSYEIDFNSLTFLGVLGEGAFGKVMKAEFYKTVSDRGKKIGELVAVKMLRDTFTTDELRNFRKEIEAMKSLEKHPHLVSIIGCCLSGPKLCLVMDYCALGDLRNYLRKYREKLMYNTVSPYNRRATLPSDNSKTPLVSSDSGLSRDSDDVSEDHQDITEEITEAELLSYARQITMGMEFLEQRKFVHRDLAARNILLSDKRHIKISDFGLTRDVYETSMYQPTSARKLPYKWMALESLFNQEFTVKSDVYQIMLSCWHPCPVSRPIFGELRVQLEDLLAETQSYIDLSIEVSGDYFHNDSTTGSRNTNTSTLVSTDENQNQKIITSIERVSVQHQIEIHNTPQESNEESSLNEELSALTSDPGDDEVFLDNDSGKNFCLFNLDNNLKDKAQDLDSLPTTNKKCSCVLCVNRESLKSNMSNCSSVQPLKHRTSFRNSLKCLIEMVGKTNKFFMPLQRKRSFSLTDVDKGGRRKIRL